MSAVSIAQEFQTTHWSVVLMAGNPAHPAARQALEALCSAYWYPIYAYVRRLGHSPHDAQDLTQGFFAHLLAHGSFQTVARDKGRFRSFMIAALKNFVADAWDKANAQKRGAGKVVAIDELAAEERYRHEPLDGDSPDKLFERQWALALFDRALDRLRQEQGAEPAHFELLATYLAETPAESSYRQLAETLQTSEGAARVRIHRFRQRYRQLVSEEIAATLAAPHDGEAELRDLLAILRRTA